MLVIASLFVSTSASLPKTSYMKMIDIWMIFCFLLPFFVVILHTIIEYLGDYPQEMYENTSNLSKLLNTFYLFFQKSRIPAAGPSFPSHCDQERPKVRYRRN